jgi:hypothetical protein
VLRKEGLKEQMVLIRIDRIVLALKVGRVDKAPENKSVDNKYIEV